MPGEIALRPVTEADQELLLAIYSSSRAMEMAAFPWSDAEKAAFLAGQFFCQDQHFRTACGGADFCIITVAGANAGRLVVHRGPAAVEIMDIALLEPFRGHGYGTRIIRQIMEEAAAAGLPVRLWVGHSNPARRLYERLGGIHASDYGPQMEFVWPVQPKTPT